MNPGPGKNILIVIPKNQFCEEELFGVHSALDATGARTVVLSPSGREALGMKKTRFTPDGMLVDWNKKGGFSGKYDAVLVVGGRGSKKSLWDETILPQILTDHHRAGSIIGAIGSSVVVLARASLLAGIAAAPDDDSVNHELQIARVDRSDQDVIRSGKIITAHGAEAAEKFVHAVLDTLE